MASMLDELAVRQRRVGVSTDLRHRHLAQGFYFTMPLRAVGGAGRVTELMIVRNSCWR